MNKTLEQLYEELENNEKLAEELQAVLDSKDKDAIEGWLKAQDCEASMAEAKAFIEEKLEEIKESGELTSEELEMAAGGTIMEGLVISGCVIMTGCSLSMAFC